MYNAENGYSAIPPEGIDITSNIIHFENNAQLLSGKIFYEDQTYIIREAKTDRYCGTGKLGNYDVYEGECNTGKIVSNKYTGGK